MFGHKLALAVSWIVAFLLLSWGRLPARWRRALALLTSAAGLLFLVLAIRTEGQHESPTVGVFLMGTPYVTEKVSASASLPYYLLSGVCLVLGFAGLVAGEALVTEAFRHPLAVAVAFSWLVTGLRFVLEKAAAPDPWTQLVGITWLAPVIGAYFVLRPRGEGKRLSALVRDLVVYALAARGMVAVLMVVASTRHLGTHYDVSALTEVGFLGQTYRFEPGSARQILFITAVSQVVFWPVYTLLSGLLGAALARMLLWAWRRSNDATPRAGARALAPAARE
jgi:hypothetical protein